jgi:hypothetical protein
MERRKEETQKGGMMVKIKTKSDTGQDLIVKVTDDSIDAYAVKKPRLVVYGKKKGISEKRLEEELFATPVMTISKTGKNDFNVDFGAGLMRGSVFGQDKKDLTEEVNVKMYHGEDIKSDKGWLEWIGLDPDDKRLDSFLDRKGKRLKEVI